MKHILIKSILALAGAALVVPAAHAAITYNSEDIVVAFNNVGPTGNGSTRAGKTLLVDIGNSSLFKTGGSLADGNIHVVNSGTAPSIVTDFGASQANLTGGASRVWSLQGANTDILDLFLSKVQPTRGTGSGAYANGSAAQPNGDILTMIFSLGTESPAATTTNAFIQNTGDAASYGAYVFGSSSPTLAYDAYGNPEGSLSSVLDLYQITDGTGAATRLGAFDFNASTGVIRFSSDISDFAPVPEPATLGFGLLGVVACASRRVRSKRVATA